LDTLVFVEPSLRVRTIARRPSPGSSSSPTSWPA